MTRYLLILHDGSQVEATKKNELFTTNNGETYKLLDARSFVNFDHITHDQYAFEQLHRTFTLKGDYSKYESLKYRCSLMEASYKTWRDAKGLDLDDPEYKVIQKSDSEISRMPVYPTNRGKWVGD